METKEFTYKQGSEGEDLLVDVHWKNGTLKNNPGKGHPVVLTGKKIPICLVLPSYMTNRLTRIQALICHGGGFVQGCKEIIPRVQLSALTNLGFVLVVPNYRLCPQISVFDGPVTDTKDCLDWAVSELPQLLNSLGPGVKIDTTKVVTMGHSGGAGLALLMASISPTPITAILDFYGGKYYSDPCWHSPNPFVATAPSWPEEHIAKVYNGPQLSSAMPYLGTDTPPPPRDAWLTTALKKGSWLAQVVKDGNFDRVDGAKGFSATFPPTMFIHGTGDTFTESRISECAYAELKDLEVETEFVAVPGAQHMLDMGLKEEDGLFGEYVMRGFEFLARKAGLL